jgi:hypothetical protein
MTGKFSISKETFKAVVLLVLGIFLIISLVFLVYKSLSRQEVVSLPKKSSDPYEVKLAEETLDSLLTKNKYGFVREYHDMERYVEIAVDGSLWKRFSIQEKRTFLKDLSRARTILGLIPDVKIFDSKKGMELASSEHGRIAVVGYDD